MSIEKQKLYNEIETLPEELTTQVINFIEYLKLSYIDTETPDSITIKSKKDLENIAGSMPILDEELTGHKNIRKIEVRNYIVFYIVDEENSKAIVLRIGHAFMDWEKYLKDE